MKFNRKKTYWERKGKYQELVDKVSESVPPRGKSNDPNVDAFRVAINAYYDYCNNGGCNRSKNRALSILELKRGTAGNKALSRIKSYGNVVDGGYMPDGMEELYEDLINAVIETYFAEAVASQLNYESRLKLD